MLSAKYRRRRSAARGRGWHHSPACWLSKLHGFFRDEFLATVQVPCGLRDAGELHVHGTNRPPSSGFYSAVAQRSKSRYWEDGWSRERGVRRRREVHMELEQLQGIRPERNHVVWRANRRGCGAIHVRGQHSADGGTLLKAYLGRSGTSQHGRAVVCAEIGAYERVAVKHVEADVIRVRPNTHFGVVIKV